MNKHNVLTVVALDYRSYNITQFKLYFGIGMIGSSLVNYMLVESSGLGSCGRQGCKTVAPVDIKPMANRP
jgi:hypothetical protein